MTAGWWEEAVCARLPDFLDSPEPDQKAVCSTCPVRHDCLLAALEEEVGDQPDKGWPVRGGLSGRERAKLLHELARAHIRPTVTPESRIVEET